AWRRHFARESAPNPASSRTPSAPARAAARAAWSRFMATRSAASSGDAANAPIQRRGAASGRTLAKASRANPADSPAFSGYAHRGEQADGLALLPDGGVPVAAIRKGQRDLVPNHPVLRLQPFRFGEFGVGLGRPSQREQRRTERDVRERVLGPEPGPLAEQV